MKKSQEQWIKEILDSNGQISRNYALSHYCSRLGARINDLKAEGWDFETKTIPIPKPDGTLGKDFVYIVKSRPQPRTLNFN